MTTFEISPFLLNALLIFILYILISLPILVYYISLKKEVSRLRLYKVRDDWIFLAANGILSKDDEIFKSIYKMINGNLEIAEELTMDLYYEYLLESSLVENQENGIEFLKFCDTVNSLPDEAKEVVKSFYVTSLKVMVAHSLSVRVYFKMLELNTRFFANTLRRFTKVRYYENVKKSQDKIFGVAATC